jgi:hypothetical protein
VTGWQVRIGDVPVDERDQKPILLERTKATPESTRAAPRPIRLETVASPPARRAPTPPPVPSRRATEHDSFSSEGAVYTGDVLKRAREARGLTVEQVCARTRIPRQHVVNLEADRYDQLPAAVYLRGVLMALSKELRLDGQKVSRSYMEAIAAAAEERSR